MKTLVLAGVSLAVLSLAGAVSAQELRREYRCEALTGISQQSFSIECPIRNDQVIESECSCGEGFLLIDVDAAPAAITLPPLPVPVGSRG